MKFYIRFILFFIKIHQISQAPPDIERLKNTHHYSKSTQIQPSLPIRYGIFLRSQKALVSEHGRQFIATKFIKDGWGKSDNAFLRFIIKNKQIYNMETGFYSLRGQFICGFSQNLIRKLNHRTALQLAGFTTTRFYQQDLSWCEKANYQGSETSHILIIPFVRFYIN